MAEGRLIDNLIHSSDHAAGAAYEFAIWYGLDCTDLLQPPTTPRKDTP